MNNHTPPKSILQKQQEEAFAQEIAKGLNDPKNTGFYLVLIQKFPLKPLNDLYKYAKEYPEVNTKGNRDLLFNYLTRRYDPAPTIPEKNQDKEKGTDTERRKAI